MGRFFCVGILLWCSAFLSSHSFRDFFLRAGTGFSCFYRRRNLIQDRADHSRTGGPSGSGGRSSSIGNFASERFGFFSGAFPRCYDSFLHTCYNGLLCFYRCRNLIQNHAGRSRTGGPKRFGPFSGAFPCSYNSSLRTRFDTLTLIATPAWLSSSDLPVPAQTSTSGQCPLWVKSRHSAAQSRCPLYPRKRTWMPRQRWHS